MFQYPEKKSTISRKAIKDLLRIVPAQTILADPKRQTVLKSIQSLIELDATKYLDMCDTLIKTVTTWFQQLPSTNNSFYSQLGGLIDHALFRTEAALELFKQFTITTNEGLSQEQLLWQYALFSASLLQGAGKIYAEYKINVYDGLGNYHSTWNALINNLTNTGGSFYDYQFEGNPEPSFRLRINLVMAKNLMPAQGFAWIASNPQVLTTWLALLQEDQREAGTLGTILIRADALAIQYYFNEILMRTAKTTRLPTTTFHMEVPESLLEMEQKAGFSFIQWLHHALAQGHLAFNRSPLFMVPGGCLIPDEVYKLFVREHPEYKNWQAIQKGFLSLGVSSSDVKFSHNKDQSIHHGDVFEKYALALPESVKFHNVSTGKTINLSAIALLHIAQFKSEFTKIETLLETYAIPYLSATGNWVIPSNQAPQPGAKHV